MATKTQKTHRNKQTFIKGKIGVPPWNGQWQMSLGGLNLVYEYEKISSLNESSEFMQETQHTQQTATRTAQNQDKKNNMNVNG